MTLRRRLLLWYTGVMAISSCLLIFVLYLLIEHKMKGEAQKFLHDEYEEEYKDLGHLANAGVDSLSELEAKFRRDIETKQYFPLAYRLYDPATGKDAIVVAAPRWVDRFRAAPVPPVPDGGRVFSIVEVGRRSRKFWVLSQLVELDGRTYVLQVGIYVRRLYKALGALQVYLPIALIVTTAVALAGGRFLASRSLQPIDSIVSHIEEVESQNLSQRITVVSTEDEVGRLRKAVNRMLERLEEAFSQVQAFTADAAHELRTPLSALMCRLEVALRKSRTSEEYREALADAMSCAAELDALVGNLLLLARLDAAEEAFEREAVDLSAVLGGSREAFSARAEQKGITLDLHICGHHLVRGNGELLRRLFGNLLDNAVNYTPAGGKVEVSVDAADDGYAVTVEDTGGGIPPEEQDKILRRFYRSDSARSREEGGTGLGLNIAQKIAQFHGGELLIESEPGKGTKVIVSLPRAHNASARDDEAGDS